MAALGKRAVTGKVMAALGLGHIDQLLAGRVGLVDRDIFSSHSFVVTSFSLGLSPLSAFCQVGRPAATATTISGPVADEESDAAPRVNYRGRSGSPHDSEKFR